MQQRQLVKGSSRFRVLANYREIESLPFLVTLKKNRINKKIALLLLLSSCGYRWADDDCTRTLCIPFAVGDEDGTLTAELIRMFGATTQARVVSRKGQYRLDVELTGEQNDRIGFRIDEQINNGKVNKNILGDESRTTLTACVTLFDTGCNEPVVGPCCVTAYIDYDYLDGDSFQDLTFVDSSGVRQTILSYSLGQLEPQESAREAATRPLYQKLSQKIVDLISARW